MESYFLDWANLLLRGVHVITAIAWIGSSFYFVFLDSSLTPPEDEDLKKQGVSGELWAVHGGGFYHPVKFAVSPPKLPGHLHWFFWESYSTWISGFALFTVSYLYSASTYLIDKSKMDWAPATAIVVALAFFFVFWPRSLLAGGRDDRHGHERQRVLLDHPRPAHRDRTDQGGRARGPHPRQTRQAAQRAQHLLHAARAVCHAQQPLQLYLEPPAKLAGAHPDDVCGRRHPPVLCDAPRLQAGPPRQPAAVCAGGRGRHRGRHRVDVPRAHGCCQWCSCFRSCWRNYSKR